MLIGGAATATGIAAPTVAGCGSSTIVAGQLASKAPWLKQMAESIVAELVGESITAGFKEAWGAWFEPTKEAVAAELTGTGYDVYSSYIFGHAVPSVTLTRLTSSTDSANHPDRLLCVRENGERVVLQAWAWKAIDAFIRSELVNRSGADLLRYRELLVKTVVPHGTAEDNVVSPLRTSAWVAYPARDGVVEVSFARVEGESKVTVKASGYPSEDSADGTERTFALV